MKQETQAILYVAKLVGVATLGSVGMLLALTYIPFKIVMAVGMVLFAGFFLKCMYDIALNDIKYRKKLNETTKK